MCCDAGTLALCKMPALLLWKSALSLVLAILPADILRSANRLLLFPDRFVIPFFLFIMGITLVLACLPACLHRFSKIRKVQSRGKSGVLFSRRWITGQICWHFTSRSIQQKETSTGNRFMHSALPFTNRYTNVLHTTSPSSPLVLHWLLEQHGGAVIRCVLLLSQTSICHPRASVTVDEECSKLVDLLQQIWPVISTGGQCQVERCFQVARGDTSKQYVALKTDALSFAVSDHKSSGAE